MPAHVVGILIFTIYAAIHSGITVSVGWLVIAMTLSVVLFEATPPVPGANLIAYILVFEQLGIPSAALIDAMIFDMLFGVLAGAANQVLLQLDMLAQADKIGLLDRSILNR